MQIQERKLKAPFPYNFYTVSFGNLLSSYQPSPLVPDWGTEDTQKYASLSERCSISPLGQMRQYLWLGAVPDSSGVRRPFARVSWRWFPAFSQSPGSPAISAWLAVAVEARCLCFLTPFDSLPTDSISPQAHQVSSAFCPESPPYSTKAQARSKGEWCPRVSSAPRETRGSGFMLLPMILEWASLRGILHAQKPMGGHKTQMFLLSPSPRWEFELDEWEGPSNSACYKKKIWKSHSRCGI